MTKTGQTKVVAQGGGGWINQDPIRVKRDGRFTHYQNSKGLVTIGDWGDKFVLVSIPIKTDRCIFQTLGDAEDKAYQILEA